MATLADSLVSSSARILPMRMRPDLTAQQQRYQGRVYWVVKEPVGLHYFRFQEEEYAILQMLDALYAENGIEARVGTGQVAVEVGDQKPLVEQRLRAALRIDIRAPRLEAVFRKRLA